jgi:hypothetical protein
VIAFFDSLRRHGMMLLFGLILISQFLRFSLIGFLIGPPANAILNLLLGGIG